MQRFHALHERNSHPSHSPRKATFPKLSPPARGNPLGLEHPGHLLEPGRRPPRLAQILGPGRDDGAGQHGRVARVDPLHIAATIVPGRVQCERQRPRGRPPAHFGPGDRIWTLPSPTPVITAPVVIIPTTVDGPVRRPDRANGSMQARRAGVVARDAEGEPHGAHVAVEDDGPAVRVLDHCAQRGAAAEALGGVVGEEGGRREAC